MATTLLRKNAVGEVSAITDEPRRYFVVSRSTLVKISRLRQDRLLSQEARLAEIGAARNVGGERRPRPLPRSTMAVRATFRASDSRPSPSSRLQVPSGNLLKTPSRRALTASCLTTKYLPGVLPGARPNKIAVPLPNHASRHTAPGIHLSNTDGREVGAEVSTSRSDDWA